jgi:hypothetical protein
MVQAKPVAQRGGFSATGFAMKIGRGEAAEGVTMNIAQQDIEIKSQFLQPI